MRNKTIFLIVAAFFAAFTTARVQAYEYILGWWDSGSSNYVKSGTFPVNEAGPAAFGFGDIVSLNNTNGMVVQAFNFLVDNYSSTQFSEPAADLILSFYSVNPNGSGSYQGSGSTLGSELASLAFYGRPMIPSTFGASSGIFQFEGLSVSVPQHFAFMVYNQSTYTTSFRVLATAREEARWNAAQGELVALSDPNLYMTYAQGYISGENLQVTIAGVPEPSTYALLLMTGAGALWWARRRR